MALHDLVELFAAAAGLPSATVRQRTGEVAGLGGADWIKADIRLAARLLSWRPRISLSQSLRDTWEASD